jgi:hypothetical protein
MRRRMRVRIEEDREEECGNNKEKNDGKKT